MFESLMLSGVRETDLLLDIGFENRTIGDKTILDAGSKGFQFVRRQSTPGNADGVVDHPLIGKSYFFDGLTSFTSTEFLKVAQQLGDVEIELEFLPTASPSYMTLMFTGGFSASIRGWNYYIQPGSRGAYHTLFVMEGTTAGNFTSIAAGLPGTVPLTGALIKTKITFKKSTDTWTLASMNDSGVANSGVRKLSSEGFFAIGSDNVSNSGVFTGYLKSIKARVLGS